MPALPTPAQALLLYGVVMFLFVSAGVVLGGKSPVLRAPVASIFAILLPSVAYAALSGVDFRASFRLRLLAPGRAALTVATMAAGYLVLTELLNLGLKLFDGGASPGFDIRKILQQELQMLVDLDWAAALFVLVILPATCEELLFRGYLLTGLERGLGRTLAVVACAFLFGLMHVIPVRILVTTLLGLFFGYVGVCGGSVGYSILAHLVNNFLVVLAAKHPDLRAVPWLHGEAHVPSFPLACAVAVLAGGLYLMRAGRPVPRPDSP